MWDLRVPRVLTAMLVGAGLAVAGATLQGLIRNPLADPYILGTATGAALGAAIAVLIPVRLVVVEFGLLQRTRVRGAPLRRPTSSFASVDPVRPGASRGSCSPAMRSARCWPPC